jgi:hypothetical protein
MKRIIFVLMIIMGVSTMAQEFKTGVYDDIPVLEMKDDDKIASVIFTEAEEQVVIQAKGMWTDFREFETCPVILVRDGSSRKVFDMSVLDDGTISMLGEQATNFINFMKENEQSDKTFQIVIIADVVMYLDIKDFKGITTALSKIN